MQREGRFTADSMRHAMKGKFFRGVTWPMKSLSGLLSVVLMSVAPAYAAAPMVKTQPGFYRIMVGDFEVTAF
jgi:hypothetical protein